MRVLTACTVVTPDAVLRPGWVQSAGDRITAVGCGLPDGVVDVELGDVVVAPGFVDVHCHGGGGAFGEDLDGSATAVALHLVDERPQRQVPAGFG